MTHSMKSFTRSLTQQIYKFTHSFTQSHSTRTHTSHTIGTGVFQQQLIHNDVMWINLMHSQFLNQSLSLIQWQKLRNAHTHKCRFVLSTVLPLFKDQKLLDCVLVRLRLSFFRSLRYCYWVSKLFVHPFNDSFCISQLHRKQKQLV